MIHDHEDRNLFTNFDPFPWQRKVLGIVHDEEWDARHIRWFYEIKGGSGKSYLKSHLVEKYGALAVDPISRRDVLHTISTKMSPRATNSSKSIGSSSWISRVRHPTS